MSAREPSVDTGIGLAVLFSLLAVGGALVMYGFPEESIGGWAFGFAMLAASLAVAVIHLY